MPGSPTAEVDAARLGGRRVPMALLTWAFVGLVLLIALVLVVLKVTQGATAPPPPPQTQASAPVVQAVTGLPAAAFDAAGVSALSRQEPAPLVVAGQSAAYVSGKPAVVFVGAEFSPYSAALRWALVAALARFGTFSHLAATSSSATEVFGDTATFSFDGTSYRSPYVTLLSTEAYGADPSHDAPAGFPALEPVQGVSASLLHRYDTEALLPFLDVGNRLLVIGAGTGFSPGLLAGRPMAQIAASLGDPTSAAGRAVLGLANELVAALCAVDGGRPEAVCVADGTRAAALRLGLG